MAVLFLIALCIGTCFLPEMLGFRIILQLFLGLLTVSTAGFWLLYAGVSMSTFTIIGGVFAVIIFGAIAVFSNGNLRQFNVVDNGKLHNIQISEIGRKK